MPVPAGDRKRDPGEPVKSRKKIRWYRKRTRSERVSTDEDLAGNSQKKVIAGEATPPHWRDLAESTETDEIDEVLKLCNKVGISNDSSTPYKATDGAAGYDLRAERTTNLPPGMVTAVPLKLRLELPPTHFALLLGRSGLAKSGILCHTGVIDSDYRSTISALLYNSGKQAVRVQKGQRVAQILVMPVHHADWARRDALSITARGEGGFGHTGST